MRITIDASPAVHHRAGLGRYAGELIQALVASQPTDEQLQILYSEPTTARPDPVLATLPARPIPLGYKPWRLRAMLSLFARWPQEGLLGSADLFHATDHLLPHLPRTPTVFTLHDLIFRQFPQYHLFYNRVFLTLMMPRFLHAADHIIAVSEHSKRDAIQAYGLPPEKFQVIYEGVDPRYRPPTDPATLAALQAKYHLPPRYILHVSTIEPRKNQQRLLDAYAAIRSDFPDVRLVMVGRQGWLFESFFAHLRALGLENEVIFPGFVPEADLPAFYQGALCFVYPSLYEGFGLPPLEALACGTPVISSNASSLPEVIGDAGILLPPTDTAALTHALRRLLSDPTLRTDLATRGPQRAAHFTWSHTAAQTRALYYHLAPPAPASSQPPSLSLS